MIKSDKVIASNKIFLANDNKFIMIDKKFLLSDEINDSIAHYVGLSVGRSVGGLAVSSYIYI